MADATSTSLREARETNGITSRLMLAYAERQGGREAVDAVLRRAGLDGREAELRDENTWFSFENKVRLFEALAEVLDDPAATRRAGEMSLELNVADGLKLALRALGSPRLVYQQIVRANAKFTTRHAMELVELGHHHARISFRDLTGGDVHRLDCAYNVGLLSCVPALFGRPPARVTHPACAVDGAERCVYDIAWEPAGGVTLRAGVAHGALAGGALLGAALAAPALLPAAGSVALGAAGLLGVRALRAHRADWRRVKGELADQAAHYERLTASLEDLVSELRIDELLDKIVRNAGTAVTGKEFALLVAEDGRLSCASSTGLPDATIATLERWAAGISLDEPALVEDVAAVRALAPVGEDAQDPMHSVCAVPLAYRGAPAGVLVALGHQPRSFLPRDVDLVRSYAAQAAIALANARLFAVQHALATRDALTGLLNHREFHEALDRELDRCRRYGSETTVVLLDLDGFKLVNDASGHAEGDRVLRETAAALIATCRQSDTAFRLGGDEFALLLPETGAEDAQVVATRAATALAGIDARTSTSYGVASWPADGGSKDVLLAQADSRLYAMKRDRRSAGATGPTPLQRDRLAMASRLSQRLSPMLDAPRIAEVAVAELHETFDYFIAYVHRVDGDELRGVAGAGRGAQRLDLGTWSQGVAEGVNGRVVATGMPQLVQDTALDHDHFGCWGQDPETDVVLRSQLAVPLKVAGRVWGVLALESPEPAAFGSDDVLLLETVAAQVGAALHRSELFAELEGAFNTTLGVLCDALETKDAYTAAHADAVGELARRVGLRLGLGDAELRLLQYGAVLHDIGKIGIRSEILTKPGPLTDDEWVEMRRHADIGADMLARIPFLASAAELVRASHERWDGGGYPRGLASDEIPLLARIICACDAYHAMTSERPYRAAMPQADAVAELQRCAGSQFDPGVVSALLAELGVAASA